MAVMERKKAREFYLGHYGQVSHRAIIQFTSKCNEILIFRFLPDGVYLNALELGEERLAREMNRIINDQQRYYNFFKWHDNYNIYDPGDDDHRESVCALCAYLNNNANRNNTQVYESITGWWNAPYPELLSEIDTSPSFQSAETESTSQTTTTATTTTTIMSFSIFSKIIDFILDYS